MATKALITEAEYLLMSFEGREPDFVNGELIEPVLGDFQHSDALSTVCAHIHPWRAGSRLFACPVLRIRTAPGQYRVVDVAVYRDRKPVDPIPTETPFIAVEIVSPDDKYREMKTKLTEYKAMGVPHVWVIDPASRSLSVFDHGSFLEVEAFSLPEFDLRFTPSQLFE